MDKKFELIKNAFILIIGKVSTQFITLLLLPLYTSKLTTTEYGIIDLITTYIVLLVPIVTIQIELGLFRFLIDCRSNEEEKKKVISNSFYIVGIISMFFLMVFIIILHFFNIKYGLFLVLMVFSTIASNMLMQSSRGLGDNIGYAISCTIIAFTNLLLNLILLLQFHIGIYSIFIATILSNLCGAVFLFTREKLYRYFSFKSLEKRMQKELMKYSLPLVPNGLIWWIINESDRTLIMIMINGSANGLYSVSNKFSNIINSFYSIFNMSWTESVSLHINDHDNFLKETFNTIFKFINCLCIFLINIMFLLFPILIESKFFEAYNYIPILIISSIFSMLSANLSAIYVAKKKTKEIAWTTIIASIINIVINLLLIQKLGLYAASISTLVSFLFLFLFRYYNVQKYVDIKLKKSYFVFYIILFSTSTVIYYLKNTTLSVINLFICIIILTFLNKSDLNKIFHKVYNIMKFKILKK